GAAAEGLRARASPERRDGAAAARPDGTGSSGVLRLTLGRCVRNAAGRAAPGPRLPRPHSLGTRSLGAPRALSPTSGRLAIAGLPVPYSDEMACWRSA